MKHMTLKQIMACRSCKALHLEAAEQALHMAEHEGIVSARKAKDFTEEEVIAWWLKQTDESKEIISL